MAHKFEKILNPQWKPVKPGDSIEGMVVMAGEMQIDSRQVPFIDVDTGKNGCFKVFCGGAALEQFFRNHNPQIGDEVGIRFDGESPAITKRGNALKEFSFWHEPHGERKPVV